MKEEAKQKKLKEVIALLSTRLASFIIAISIQLLFFLMRKKLLIGLDV